MMFYRNDMTIDFFFAAKDNAKVDLASFEEFSRILDLRLQGTEYFVQNDPNFILPGDSD